MLVTLFGMVMLAETQQPSKSTVSDAGDAVWNGDAGETVAITKA